MRATRLSCISAMLVLSAFVMARGNSRPEPFHAKAKFVISAKAGDYMVDYCPTRLEGVTGYSVVQPGLYNPVEKRLNILRGSGWQVISISEIECHSNFGEFNQADFNPLNKFPQNAIVTRALAIVLQKII